MLIRISGLALVFMEDGGDLDNPDLLKRLDALESGELCSDYMDAELADLGIVGGSVKLEHIGGGEFRVVSEYRSPVRLVDSQVERLTENTVGQWSDGIGEGGFFEETNGLGVCVNLSPLEQESRLRIEQIDDGEPVEPPNVLAKAAREGNLPLLRVQLEAGAEIERRLQRYTPLHLAVIHGHAETALELIRHGANIHALDPMGEDSLMMAVLSNSVSDDDAAIIATALLKKGLQPNAHGPSEEFPLACSGTPLELALQREKHKLAAVLREFGATE
jgi:uncharacterized protein